MTSSGFSLAHVMSAQSGHSPSQPSPNSEYDSPQVRHFSIGRILSAVRCVPNPDAVPGEPKIGALTSS